MMAKIYAPNKQYNGISAGVTFVQGVGESSNPHLLDWFKSKGYEVADAVNPLEEMTVDELKAYAAENNIDIGQSTSQKGILKKILEAENKE